MTQDEIIEMARQSGLMDRILPNFLSTPKTENAFVSFAKLVAAKEREACARLSQTLPNTYKNCQISSHASDMAIMQYSRAIRARSQND